jgi:hypothetical protein
MVMATLPRPNISSFIIRFVVTTPGDSPTDQPVYHGVIRHIQSDEELNFSSWKEVESFIRRFIPIEETYN